MAIPEHLRPDPFIVPWAEFNRGTFGGRRAAEFQNVVDGIAEWRKITDIVAVSGVMGSTDGGVYAELARLAPPDPVTGERVYIMAGLKTVQPLAGRIDNETGWAAVAAECRKILAHSPMILLENEGPAGTFGRGDHTLDEAAFRRGLRLLPKARPDGNPDIAYVWYPAIGSAIRERALRYRRTMRIIAEELGDRVHFTYQRYGGPLSEDHVEHVEAEAEMRTRLAAEHTYAWAVVYPQGRPRFWDVAEVRALLFDRIRDHVLLYPSAARWVSLAQQVTAELLPAPAVRPVIGPSV